MANLSLVELLRARAQGPFCDVVYTFLLDGDEDERKLSFRDLDLRARAVATRLRQFGVPGDRALILCPPGLDYLIAFFGCLYAGIVAVPAYSPRSNRSTGRLQSIILDSQPVLGLTTPQIFRELEARSTLSLALRAMKWCSVEDVADDEASDWLEPPLKPEVLAFLQYTSGSTGSPKGVMLSHSNLLHNQRMIQSGYEHGPETRFVGWLPPFHDMGLIGNILQPLYLGTPSVLLSPSHFLEKPLRWLQAISRHKGTTSGGPNFAYELCLRKIAPTERAGLDLSSWTVAFNGSEPVRADTLTRFTEAFQQFGFRPETFCPCYGLAEASLIVSGGFRSRVPVIEDLEDELNGELGQRSLVGSGKSLLDQTVLIVHPDTCVPCGEREVGEIWVSGPSVAQGYWQDKAETEQVFHGHVKDAMDSPSFLRTGDLGFLSGDELFVTGRLKDLIIIRGRNHYPQDIERTAEQSHPMLVPDGGAAFSVDVGAEEKLVVVHEVHRHCRGEELERVVAAIRHSVSEHHDLQVYGIELIKHGRILKTSSGKIRRRACRTAFLSGTFAGVAREMLALPLPEAACGNNVNTLDRVGLLALEEGKRHAGLTDDLRERISRVLNVSEKVLNVEIPLTTFGIDSLQAIELVHDIEASFGVALPVSFLLEDYGITQIAASVLDRLLDVQQRAVLPESQALGSPLSSGQRALCFLQQLNPKSTAYNLARAIEISAPVDVPVLRRACSALIARHASLRTVFRGDVAHVVGSIPEEALTEVDAREWSEVALDNELCNLAHAPFNLEQGPLVRFRLYKTVRNFILVICAHHAIADLESFLILIDEIGFLYRGGQLGPNASAGVTHALAELALLASPEGDRLFEYWKKMLAAPLEKLDLPVDRPRQRIRSDRGAVHVIRLGIDLTRRVESLARSVHATLFATLLATFNVLLHRLTGQDDIVVGSPMANRRRVDKRTIGHFMNPVVLRANLSRNPRFVDLLAQVRSNVNGALTHQAFPFAELVSRLKPSRDQSRSPLFDVMFTLQTTNSVLGGRLSALALGAPGVGPELGGFSTRTRAIETRASAFDLTLNLAKTEDELCGVIHYSAELFDRETVERIERQFVGLLKEVVNEPKQRIDYIPLLVEGIEKGTAAKEESDEMLAEACIPHLFEAQVSKTPDAIALVFENARLTYTDLDTRASNVAHSLRKLGVGPDVLVAVLIDRSIAMVVALLGVLKAGGAYLPLDPAYPRERLDLMIEDAEARVLLTESGRNGIPGNHSLLVLRLDGTGMTEPCERQYEVRNANISPENLAYIIYTSGSTGQPKGVEIRHRAVANVLNSVRCEVGITQGDTVLALTTISFDIAALEIFLPLTVGATLLLVDQWCAADGSELVQILATHGVTIMQATPATWRMLIDAGWQGTPALSILCGGEVLAPALANDLLRLGRALYNMYGPTETTIWSAMGRIDRLALDVNAASVPVGPPIARTTVEVCDEYAQPLPIGVVGEIYIGGDGLARAYRNRPELTGEKFAPDTMSASAGARLYRTGDRARRRADGRIDFLGRFDHQLKIRGVRLEPGEIEMGLRRHPSVKDAVVMARADSDGTSNLVAYVATDAEEPFRDELSALLRRTLPEQYIPAIYVFMPAFPLTPAQKVDRSSLSARQANEPRRDDLTPRTETERRAAAIWKEVLDLPRLGIDDDFFELGGHSLLMGRVRTGLEAKFQRKLPMRDLFQHATVRSLAVYLDAIASKPGAANISTDSSPLDAAEARCRQRGVHPNHASMDVAIIGLAGRFPGAKNINEYWQNLIDGNESITFFREEELLAAGVSAAVLEDNNYIRANGLLGDADLFDASFFGISPREAEAMDPQHRHFLECGWSALESAGCNPDRYEGRIGVYAGSGLNTYLLRNVFPGHRPSDGVGGLQLMLGGDKDFVATRLSFKLNLKGPSVAVQSACSTSLVAVHLACRSLVGHECDVALAGAVTIRTPEVEGYFFDQGMTFSPDGHCRAFDAKARGFVPANGIGIVVLKRLTDALVDGDHIHAVIKGSAINNDGALKIGYTAPGLEGQVRVIRDAYAVARVEPCSISYIEAHGTGTPIGDAIEIGALNTVFGADGAQKKFCALGSVKTNIGHTDTAAGIAGLIKAALSLENGLIPPSLNFDSANPEIDLGNTAFYVNTRLTEWDRRPTPRRAGVSSFGLGGTNAHVVLEEAPLPAPRLKSGRRLHLLPISARTAAALEVATDELANHLRTREVSVAHAAWTLGSGRRTFSHRRVVICEDRIGAAQALSTRDPRCTLAGEALIRQRPVAFLLPGLGDQYVLMSRGLYLEEPAFRVAVDRCCEILKAQTGIELAEILYPVGAPDATWLKQTLVLQPALFVLEYSLARLWAEWGVQPATMLGHSLGEYAAACLAGVWTLEEALTIVAARARMIDALPVGAMLAVSLPESAARELMCDGVWLAAVNGPSRCVLSGKQAAIENVARRLADAREASLPIQTSHAFHSEMMRAISAPFGDLLASIDSKPPQLPYISSLTGTWITADQVRSPDYWIAQMCGTVRFGDGIEELLKAETSPILLELGPGGSLCALARQHSSFRDAIAIPSLRHAQQREDDATFFSRTAAKLWLAGADIDWNRQYAHENPRRVPLPTYPFERKRYWIAPLDKSQPASKSGFEKDPDIANWFYIHSWKRTLAPATKFVEQGSRWLIFRDDVGLGDDLAARVESAGGEAICVAMATRFEKTGERAYSVNPRSESDYAALLDTVGKSGTWPSVIVHLSTVTIARTEPSDLRHFEACLSLGFHSLLLLAKALQTRHPPSGSRLVVVSSALQEVSEEEAQEPEKSTVLAACKVVSQEFSNVRCEHFDVQAHVNTLSLADRLISEICGPSPGAPIALRGAYQRMAQSFEHVRLEKALRATGFRTRGIYLITGGLGNLGLTIAVALARDAQARLVLLGRTPLPSRDRWESWIEEHGDRDPNSRRIRRLLDLEELGAEFLLVTADVADELAMRSAFEQIHSRFGDLHGVIHAAGTTGDIVSISDFEPQDAARQFRAKCYGLYVLSDLLRERRVDFVALFSSTASVLAGPGLATYAAASAFMDSFACEQNKAAGNRWISIGWDGWWTDDVTQGETAQTAIGRYFMTSSEALDAMSRVLASSATGSIVVSTGDLESRLRTWTNHRLDDSGNQKAAPARTAEHRAPESGVEKTIAELWGEVLGVQQVGIHDSFFALGGDSLIGIKIVGRLRKIFQVEISMRHLWQNPTVSQMGMMIEELIIDQLLDAPSRDLPDVSE